MEIPYVFPIFSLVGGFKPSEKYEFVSWDDDIPNIWKVIKVMFQNISQWEGLSHIWKIKVMFQTNNQS